MFIKFTEYEEKQFEKLVEHVYANADLNESYRNVTLICRYFELYQLMEFRALRQAFLKLHREAENTSCASFHESPVLGMVWGNYRSIWDKLVRMMFDFLALNIGQEKAEKLEYAFNA